MEGYAEKLDKTENFSDIFEIVQDVVSKMVGTSRGGLNLGLAELGNGSGGWLGAYYPTGSNIIVMNRTPLRRLAETKPQLTKPYVFMILLHEYLHSLGYLGEKLCRTLTYEICKRFFGDSHEATEMAYDVSRFMKYLTYPQGFPQMTMDEEGIEIEGLDRDSGFYFG